MIIRALVARIIVVKNLDYISREL